MTKKLIAMLLALVMLVTCLPMSVLAVDAEEIEDPSTEVYEETAEAPAADAETPAEAAEAPAAEAVEEGAAAAETTEYLEGSGSCGNNLTWTLTHTGILTISGTGDLYGRPWDGKTEIRQVVIKSGVTSIGDGVFSNNPYLTSVSIPATVKSIGNKAFYCCGKLNSLTISNGVRTIGEHAFYDCDGLKSVTIPKSVTEIGYEAFMSCSNLKTVKIQSTATHVEGRAFFYDPWADAQGDLLVINNVLVQCNNQGITSAVVPFGVTEIAQEAFSGCASLSEIVIPSDVTTIARDAFEDCARLIQVHYTGTQAQWNAIDGCGAVNLDATPRIDYNYYYIEWKKSGSKWYLYVNNVMEKSTFDWVSKDGVYGLYHLDYNGVMTTGWLTYGGDTYYFDKTTGVMLTGWQKISKKWYFFNTEELENQNGEDMGAMLKGWQELPYEVTENGQTWTETGTFYLDPKTGVMKTGWQTIKDEDGVSYKYYFMPSTGAMKTGWLYLNGNYYFLNRADLVEANGLPEGALLTGRQYLPENNYTTDSYRTFFFDKKKGFMHTGWITDGGHTYYFSKTSGSFGYMYYGGLKEIDGKWYAFDDDGIMMTDAELNYNGNTYYFTSKGNAATGWQTVNVTGANGTFKMKRYFDTSTAIMYKNGVYKIGSKWYYFDGSGYMVTDAWKTVNGNTYYFTSKGNAATGWQTVNVTGSNGTFKMKCYFDTSTAVMYCNGLYYISGKYYYFDGSGYMVTDAWKKINGNWYYLTSKGNAATGWQTVNVTGANGTFKEKCYFNTSTAIMYQNNLYKISGKYYYFDGSGYMLTDTWKKVNGNAYYFTSKGNAATGKVKIGGTYYTFDKNGVCSNPPANLA